MCKPSKFCFQSHNFSFCSLDNNKRELQPPLPTMSAPESLLELEFPPFQKYRGQESFFGGEAPLSVGIGYLVVLGFGGLFSVFTTCLILVNKYFGKRGEITSEHFK
jgi:hypothetical protein